MFAFIEKILLCFRPCLSRKAAFSWFVTIIVGLMVRSDMLRITSVIRSLSLDSALYNSMMYFFRADSWGWEDIFTTWVQTVSEYAPLKRIAGRTVLVGDGVKRASDGRYMPCTKKMVQMLRDGFRSAQHVGRSLLILDRYFLTRSMLLEWRAYSAETPGLLHVITRAKRNCIAYERPGSYKGRGRRPVRGDAIRLQELFVSESESFQHTQLRIYGVEREVRFLSKTYLWGKGLYHALQSVHVEYGETRAILVCTDLTMPAEDIITAYAYRFKIEAMFREMKQQIGGLFYHFWTNAVPRLDRYRKKGADDPLSQVKDEHEQQRIIKTLTAIEGYVMLSSIAMGIIQMLCLEYDGKIRVSDFRYLRTPSHQVMSGASMMEFLRRDLFRFMA